jgi:hypothetical protein
MTDSCSLCEETLNNLPCTELLCHHKYHTQCFLTNIATGHQELHAIHCVVCEQGVFAAEQDNEDHEENHFVGDHTVQDDVQFLQLYETNAQFREDLKKCVKAGEESSKPRKAFHTLLLQKKRELKEILEPHIAEAQAAYDTKKDELLESEAFKNYKKTNGKWLRLWTKLVSVYHVNRYNVSYLRSKPGLRRLHAPTYYERRSVIRLIRWSLGYRIFGGRMRL